MTADAGNVRSDGDARVARWAKAAEDAGTYMMGAMAEATVGVRDADDWVGPASVEAAATFLVPVADGELAELRAEVERLRTSLYRLLGATAGVPTMLNEMASGRKPGPVGDMARRMASRLATEAAAVLDSHPTVCDSPNHDECDCPVPPMVTGGLDPSIPVVDLDSHPTGTPEGGEGRG